MATEAELRQAAKEQLLKDMERGIDSMSHGDKNLRKQSVLDRAKALAFEDDRAVASPGWHISRGIPPEAY